MPQSNYNAIKALFDKYDAVYDGISNDIADLKEASGETFQSARKDLKQILRSTQPDDLGNVELTDNEAADVQAAQALLYSDRYRRWL